MKKIFSIVLIIIIVLILVGCKFENLNIFEFKNKESVMVF